MIMIARTIPLCTRRASAQSGQDQYLVRMSRGRYLVRARCRLELVIRDEFRGPTWRVALGPTLRNEASEHRPQRLKMRERECDMPNDDESNCCCHHVVHEGRAGAPFEWEIRQPMHDRPGPQHDYDHRTDEDDVEFLTWIEFVRTCETMSSERSQPQNFLAGPEIAASQVGAQSAPPRSGERNEQRERQGESAPHVNFDDEMAASD